ncbi:hypothetical protein [Mycoplasmopsis gallinarum]|uniref:hypothetical protein n=1 Tax=Mycoplasmopsis gallinarum TaxID=29557 RepID=UPI0004810BB9|nr:hypothetical protein [Mycoplasmopsis gallinarum]
MANKFLGLTSILNNAVSIVNIVNISTNPNSSESQWDNNATYEKYELFLKIDLLKTNKKEIEKIVNNIEDEAILRNLFWNVHGFMIEEFSNRKTWNKILREKRDQIITEYKKYLIKDLLSKREILVKEFKSNKNLKFDYVETEDKNYINLDSEISSKKIFYSASKIKEQLNEIKKEIEPLIKQAKEKEEIIIKLNKYLIGLSSTSIGSAILTIFCPFFAAPTAISAYASTAISSFIIYLKKEVNIIYETINRINKFFINKIDKKNVEKDVINIVLSISVGLRLSRYIQAFKISEENKAELDFSIPAVFDAIITIGQAGYQLYCSSEDIKESNNNINKLFEMEKKLFENILKTEMSIEKIKSQNTFIVIGETPLTDEYKNGGKGGKNILFKNIKENKNYTLEEMLSKSKEELYLYNLIKVYNSKLDEWYIRSLPNKIKEDNLG